MKESHFKNLNPTPTAERLHEVLAIELGPIIANAALRRASDRCHIPIDQIRPADIATLVPVIVQALRSSASAETLRQGLQDLIAEMADQG